MTQTQTGGKMQQVSLEEAKTRLQDLVAAALRGETVSIAVDDDQAVQLVPIALERRPGQYGSAKGLVWMSEDFDAPLEEFKAYME
jgi:antitoxin (DNA-binding transcriptional repressor) of toxin-antitoxin stability system